MRSPDEVQAALEDLKAQMKADPYDEMWALMSRPCPECNQPHAWSEGVQKLVVFHDPECLLVKWREVAMEFVEYLQGVKTAAE